VARRINKVVEGWVEEYRGTDPTPPVTASHLVAYMYGPGPDPDETMPDMPSWEEWKQGGADAYHAAYAAHMAEKHARWAHATPIPAYVGKALLDLAQHKAMNDYDTDDGTEEVEADDDNDAS
jgi:hypothetical protein